MELQSKRRWGGIVVMVKAELQSQYDSFELALQNDSFHTFAARLA